MVHSADDDVAKVDRRVVRRSPPVVVMATPLVVLQASQPTVEVLTNVNRRVSDVDDDETTDSTVELNDLFAVT